MCLAASGILAVGLIAGAPAKAQPATAPLGADLGGLLAAGRRLSPALRAAALETAAASAKAEGAGRLADPTISDSYQYYRDPGVFSGHSVMLSQHFPLWGKLSLRRQAALDDVDAARGRARAAQDKLDEEIEVAYARYYLITRDIVINRQISGLAGRIHAAAAARYGQGGGSQDAVIQAAGEETDARIEAVRLEGEKSAARARLNMLVGRSPDAPLADPVRARPIPALVPPLAALLRRALAANPVLSTANAAIAAAQTRSKLADKAWYPDLTVAAGPLIQTNNQPVGFAATVGFNIPFPWGREAPDQREAEARLGATQERYDAARLEIAGALREATAKLRASRATERLLRREAVPQAQAGFQSALADYSSGTGELVAAIAAERHVHETEIRLLQAQFDEQVELATIEKLIGGDI